MLITALCPSYRRPALLNNTVALWRKQTDNGPRRLIILEDGGIYEKGISKEEDLTLYATDERYPSLPTKYNTMLLLADQETEAFIVWEDDDIYLPHYVEAYRIAFEAGHDLVKPSKVLSDYNNYLEIEDGGGRFHASLGFTRELITRVNGWPLTDRADFDQQLISNLTNAAENPCYTPFDSPKKYEYPGYVFSWHTGHHHGQHSMKSPDDVTWYQNSAAFYEGVPHQGRLNPSLDMRTKSIFRRLAI